MVPPLPPDLKEKWLDLGFKAALDAYYVSSLEQKDVVRDIPCLSGALGQYWHAMFVKIDGEGKNEQPWITTSFDGSFTFRADMQTRTMRGRYLRLIVPQLSKENRPATDASIVTAVNLLRVKYGIAAAVEKADLVE